MQHLLAAWFIGSVCMLGALAHPEPVPGYDIEEPLIYGTFPEGFKWGTATAAYQVLIWQHCLVMPLINWKCYA